MEELTVEEIKTIYDLLGNMNYYETMAILCRQTYEIDTESKQKEISRIIFKIGRIVDMSK
jgi:hypothetical protein